MEINTETIAQNAFNAITEKIKNLKIVLDDPVSAGEFGRLSGDRLFVMLHNSADKPFSVTLGLNGKGLIARKSVKAEMPEEYNDLLNKLRERKKD